MDFTYMIWYNNNIKIKWRNSMVFKSYSWNIGTTSFRTKELNYKIERQLQLLKEFWIINPNLSWNNVTQTKYYNYLKENNFTYGEAKRPDKDAREKTSGLVDIGVITSNRRLTEVGTNIEKLLDKHMNKDNIFMTSEDSYKYLLQFLKLQITDSGIKIKPFIALIYMIEELGYLTYDEFTYLLPLCKNKYDVKKMTQTIKNTTRNGFPIDELINIKILEMDNYIKALYEFSKEYPVTEKTFEYIGMNRKSKSYDRCYNAIYHTMVDLVFHLKTNTFEERIPKYQELFEECKKISGNARGLWQEYLFMGYKIKNIDEEFDRKFKDLSISNVKNIIDFKKEFFTKLHCFKWKVNLKEYFDLNKRYFSLTDIIKFEDERIELDMLPKYYFKDIIEKLLDEDLLDIKEYINLFTSDVKIEAISPLYNISQADLVNKINKELKTNLTVNNINSYINDQKLESFNKLIDMKFKVSDLIRILKQIKNREDDVLFEYVTDNANIPTIFEYILGIAWYRISGKVGNILEFMNLSLDANLLPKTHAGGGMADIVYKYDESTYPKHNLLIEATLSESTGQRHMEMEPVSRHLGENIKVTNNSNDYVLFVANKLETRVILDFRNMKTRFYPKDNGEFINGLKIIPIDIDILIKILESNINYNNIYAWFDKAYKSETPDPNWYNEEILKNI